MSGVTRGDPTLGPRDTPWSSALTPVVRVHDPPPEVESLPRLEVIPRPPLVSTICRPVSPNGTGLKREFGVEGLDV